MPAAGHLYWDLLHLWQHVRQGLRKMADTYRGQIGTIGLDTWGVDFGLLGRGDELLGNPYNYRDARTQGMLERALAIVPREEIFAATGVQFMQINTLYQLLAMRVGNSPLLDQAESLLMMPDLFNWLLTGVKVNELTDATTTQCFDPRSRNWAFGLLERLGIPTGMFWPDRPERRQRWARSAPRWPTSWGWARQKWCCPARTTRPAPSSRCRPKADVQAEPDWCYISSGTWSLMGVEIPAADSRPSAAWRATSPTKGASAAPRGC